MPTYDVPTVLLIEDNPDDERLALRAMRTCGLPLLVKVARDGSAALRVLGLDGSTSSFQPDLIVCDLKLPVINGDSVLRHARADARFTEIPFVIFSSSDDHRDRDFCFSADASDFVTKPVAYEEYIACVRRILLQWLATWRPQGSSCQIDRATLSGRLL